MTTTPDTDPRLAIGQRWADKRDAPRVVEITDHRIHRQGARTVWQVQVAVVVPSSWAGPKSIGRRTWIKVDRIADSYAHQATS
jgi:hypothetical protein